MSQYLKVSFLVLFLWATVQPMRSMAETTTTTTTTTTTSTSTGTASSSPVPSNNGGLVDVSMMASPGSVVAALGDCEFRGMMLGMTFCFPHQLALNVFLGSFPFKLHYSARMLYKTNNNSVLGLPPGWFSTFNLQIKKVADGSGKMGIYFGAEEYDEIRHIDLVYALVSVQGVLEYYLNRITQTRIEYNTSTGTLRYLPWNGGQLKFSGGLLSSIENPNTGRVTTITRNGNGSLSKITHKAHRLSQYQTIYEFQYHGAPLLDLQQVTKTSTKPGSDVLKVTFWYDYWNQHQRHFLSHIERNGVDVNGFLSLDLGSQYNYITSASGADVEGMGEWEITNNGFRRKGAGYPDTTYLQKIELPIAGRAELEGSIPGWAAPDDNKSANPTYATTMLYDNNGVNYAKTIPVANPQKPTEAIANHNGNGCILYHEIKPPGVYTSYTYLGLAGKECVVQNSVDKHGRQFTRTFNSIGALSSLLEMAGGTQLSKYNVNVFDTASSIVIEDVSRVGSVADKNITTYSADKQILTSTTTPEAGSFVKVTNSYHSNGVQASAYDTMSMIIDQFDSFARQITMISFYNMVTYTYGASQLKDQITKIRDESLLLTSANTSKPEFWDYDFTFSDDDDSRGDLYSVNGWAGVVYPRLEVLGIWP